MKREADMGGSQRKILSARVAPLRLAHGDSGIPVRKGRTLPFVVERTWSAPAGHYTEQWFVVEPESREVLHEGPVADTLIWGLQAPTALTDEVHSPLELEPGTYLVVFALNGTMGGDLTVEASEASAEEAV